MNALFSERNVTTCMMKIWVTGLISQCTICVCILYTVHIYSIYSILYVSTLMMYAYRVSGENYGQIFREQVDRR